MSRAARKLDSTVAEGIRLDPGQEKIYRERTARSLSLLERTKPLIPTGHGGGMWYQLPYPVLIDRGKGSKIWDADGNTVLETVKERYARLVLPFA